MFNYQPFLCTPEGSNHFKTKPNKNKHIMLIYCIFTKQLLLIMFGFVVQYCIYVVQKPYICTTKNNKEWQP